MEEDHLFKEEMQRYDYLADEEDSYEVHRGTDDVNTEKDGPVNENTLDDLFVIEKRTMVNTDRKAKDKNL